MSKIDWPQLLQDSAAARSLERALEQGRLGHALVFVANDVTLADGAARALAQGLLGGSYNTDYAFASPENKMRQIGVDAMRGLREFLQKSTHSGRKVVHISQADRLGREGANLFLKIFEEPPEGSTIILTTSEPAALMPTLLSRAMRFRFDTTARAEASGSLASFCEHFRALLQKGADPLSEACVMHEAYQLLQQAEEDAEKQAKALAKTSEDEIPEEQLSAQVAQRQKAFKKELFSAIEREIIDFYENQPSKSFALKKALVCVERAYRLTVFNLNSAVALEAAIGGATQAFAECK